jgi:hypothetical protein
MHAALKFTWVIAAGMDVSFFGKLFAKIYEKNLDNAIPALIEEMKASKGGTV